MKAGNLKIFIDKMAQENEQKLQKINAEKRKKHFQEIGRKGGLKKKSEPQLSKVISFRLTDLEYEDSQKKAQEFNLKLSAYSRMVHLQKELKVHEFTTDKTLLNYGNNFVRITNLLRNREWNMFQNKKQILKEIQELLDLIREYLYSKMKNKNLK
ncbi:plasmid mobilization protein [Kaistella yonginensis]|uniref:plasmid mobilization protein n=1 Tax=Kaistella yonginensis TaxID=658267 RepID=UPI0025B281F2|nr:special sigma factor [Kaistella yonginensis]MDN3606758.1 special sigma factor [Kaistella yonginensis]